MDRRTVTLPARHARDAFDARARVEVRGEPIGGWLEGRALGDLASCALPVGAYAYKLRVDGAWALDPANPRTRSRRGARDNVLGVGATPEPLLFAPAAPFVVEADRGGLIVTAWLRRGAGASLTLRWTERDEARAPMRPIAEEDEHVVFRARVPASSAEVRFAFDLDGGASVDRDEEGGALVYARAPASEALPSWWRRARVYAIFVDRFRPARDDDGAAWRRDPGADVAAGGHLDGVTRSLDAIVDLGFDALYLTPVHVGASCHRYDVVDPLRVDPALGGEAAFARLVDGCRARGVRLLVDFSLSHAGPGFPPYEDVRARGRASPFASWFRWGADGALCCYGKRSDAPLLDLDAPPVRALALEAAEGWARRGVDGLRLDAAAEVPFDLARAVRDRLRAIRPEAIVLGEVVPPHAWRWRRERAVDAATDFAFHGALQDLVARRTIDAAQAVARLGEAEAARGGPQAAALRFASTHDHARLATLARAAGHERLAPLAHALLFTWPGVPALLYGEEIGLAADVAHLEPEGAWPDRMPMRWDAASHATPLRAFVRALARARASSPALTEGEIELLHAEGDLLVFRRAAGGDVIDVAVHVGDAEVAIDLDDDDAPAMEAIATWGAAEARAPRIALRGPSCAIVRRARAASGANGTSGADGASGEAQTTTSPRRLAIVHNARARDAAFAAGDLAARAWPTRIDFALTERCNLRCAHCITFAPERTARGTARTLSPWLLDRLRGALSYAEYVGFVHGGESLATPMLFEALRAISAARGGAPWTAHLLTNGLLLGEETTRRLIDAGVRSIAVSLDGARAETNDAVRVGGRFEAVVENVRAAVRVRRARAVDLRLGLSLVVMRSNVGELDAFVDLAASLGVDWIKLEEVAPVTPLAARSLVRFDEPRARDAVARAIRRAEERGLVAVDHTDPPPVWRCHLEPRAARFLAADEHANRSAIHPCRAAWEIACVEPNGDVRAGDFFAPVVGNVGEASLLDIWSSEAARVVRARARASRLCGGGPVVCV